VEDETVDGERLCVSMGNSSGFCAGSMRSRHINWTSPVSEIQISDGRTLVNEYVLLGLSNEASSPSSRSLGIVAFSTDRR